MLRIAEKLSVFHHYIIHVVICEIQVSILHLPVNYDLVIEPLRIKVGTIIIWQVISLVSLLEDEGFDVVGS